MATAETVNAVVAYLALFLSCLALWLQHRSSQPRLSVEAEISQKERAIGYSAWTRYHVRSTGEVYREQRGRFYQPTWGELPLGG